MCMHRMWRSSNKYTKMCSYLWSVLEQRQWFQVTIRDSRSSSHSWKSRESYTDNSTYLLNHQFSRTKLHLYKYWMIPGMDASTEKLLIPFHSFLKQATRANKVMENGTEYFKSFESSGPIWNYFRLISTSTHLHLHSASLLPSVSVRHSECRETHQFI